MAPSDVHVLTTEIVDAPVPIVRVTGELDLSTVAQLSARCTWPRPRREPPRLIVDLLG